MKECIHRMPTYTTICYKLKNPVIYNKGTKYEKYEYTFLARYTYKSKEEAQKEVDEINKTHPQELFGKQVDWNNTDYYFIDEQELFSSF